MNILSIILSLIFILKDVSINKIDILESIFNNSIIQQYQIFKRKEDIKDKYKHIPMDLDHICYLIQVCSDYSIDPDIILALIEVESKYDPNAKNKNSSAAGYGQLIASTAKSIAKEIDFIKSYNHKIDAYDPYINIHLMVHYFSKCIDNNNGNIYRALKSYRGCNDVPYFNKVMSIRKRIKENKKL